MARFWFRRLRRADDGGPVYVLELDSPSPPVREPPSLDAVHFGREGARARPQRAPPFRRCCHDGSTLRWLRPCSHLQHKSVASVEPLTDFAAYRGQPLNKAELTEPRTKLKTSPGASRITVERDTTTTSGSSTRSPHTESTSTTK
ncbi:hypothetical protein MTO96_039838 [Rhipicephalus appendiculatus]